jgi:hypothetical protein
MAGISSHCIEVRNLSLNRAHVAHEQFIDCWPLPQVDGSPALKVLSASLTATGSSGLPRFVTCQTLQAPLEPGGSPLFT